MKTNHTPGPWALDTTNIVGPNNELIVDRGSLLWLQGQGQANARLISAAPEMLEALEDAEFLMRQAAKYPGPMQDSFKRSAADARAALAKATGEKI